MSGTKAGGLKAAATNKVKYGGDFYRNIGQKGGRNGHTGGFAANPELARRAGAKGGQNSIRTVSAEKIMYGELPQDILPQVMEYIECLPKIHGILFPNDTHFKFSKDNPTYLNPYLMVLRFVSYNAEEDKDSAYNRNKVAAVFSEYLLRTALLKKNYLGQRVAANLRAILRQVLRGISDEYNINYPSSTSVENALIDWQKVLKRFA